MKQVISLVLTALILVSLVPAFASADAPASMELHLESNASTGYVWVAVSSDASIAIVETVRAEAAGSEQGLVGQSGETVLRICGVAAGTAEVELKYTRSWEESDDDIRLSIPVQVDDGLNVALGLCDPENPDFGYGFQVPFQADSQASWDTSSANFKVSSWTAFDWAGGSLSSVFVGFDNRKDGTDTVKSTYSEPDSTEPIYRVRCDVEVKNGQILMPKMEFRFTKAVTPPELFKPEFTFTTTDRDGNTYTEQIFASYALTIVNFWEPWCGPCVSEMPSMEMLYQMNNEAAGDIMILGVYSTTNQEKDVKQILKDCKITYPILHYVKEFDAFQTGYVPTTIIVDSTGRIVYGPVSKAMRFSEWSALVAELS